MEKYRRKTVGEELEEASAENEIRIATHGKIKNYVANVLNLLKDGNHENVVIVGKGKAINKAVTVVEIAKRRLDGKVKQETDIYSVEATDVWDPVEEDLDSDPTFTMYKIDPSACPFMRIAVFFEK